VKAFNSHTTITVNYCKIVPSGDMVIVGKAIAEKYLLVCSQLGIKVERSESLHVSGGSLEHRS